ncbi:MAG TPA: Npt1/Npt2 family nucleotide transporter [Gemmatimonadota bacterium]|nr:Npt1/Npt2 family nucleotide transporter [Gemmatimonadota bacterium]
MTILKHLSDWLDVRPNEVRNVTLAFLGAFLVMSFAILARALREALYLTAYNVETLPYIMVAVAVLSVPTVGVFSRLLSRHSPRRVVMALLIMLAAGLAALWPFVGRREHLGGEVVAFYLWTSLGTLLVTSGFWVVTSEYFPVRGAKRLFGLIGAGGTAGAMVTGNSLVWLSRRVELPWLVALLIAITVLFFLTQRLLPPLADEGAPGTAKGEKSSMRESLALTWRTPHLRAIAAIVFTVGLATTLLDYQFKDYAQATFNTQESLTSFFGAFYGWTGLVSLALQLLVVSRLLALAGVAWTLAVLPLVLMLGSVGILAVPSLYLVTAVRGADASLRKSLYRSALEVVYVPVPSLIRRKTKTFIDSVVDSAGEGVGAAAVVLVVTLAGFQSRFLSVFVIGLAAALIFMNRRMGGLYFTTVTEQLQQSGGRAEVKAAAARLDSRDLLSGSFTRLDIRALTEDGAISAGAADEVDDGPDRPRSAQLLLRRLGSSDMRVVARALEENADWNAEHVPTLARLLTRDPLVDRVVVALFHAGDAAVPHLASLLRKDETDFVIRRRIPRILARLGDSEADDALLEALNANRFEVRYRAAIALVRRRRQKLPASPRWNEALIWDAVRNEIGRDRAVWEMQKLLDDAGGDDLVAKRVGVRGELSLEHTFRLLSLVLEPDVVRAAFNGVVLDDERLKSFSLEYLDQALPADVRKKLWPFIGDVSEYQRERSLRSLDDVVSDLVKTGATLFADVEDREALKRVLEQSEEEEGA